MSGVEMDILKVERGPCANNMLNAATHLSRKEKKGFDARGNHDMKRL